MKSIAILGVATATLLVSSFDAGADTDAHTRKTAASTGVDTAISLQLATLDTTGGSIQGERALGTAKLSVAVALGFRSAAMGDYDSKTFGVGAEVRRWFRDRAITGWFVGARGDYAHTSMHNEAEDYRVGSLSTASLSLTGGYRFVLFRHLEITPTLGLGSVAEGGMGGKSPTSLRPMAVVGLTAGAIF